MGERPQFTSMTDNSRGQCCMAAATWTNATQLAAEECVELLAELRSSSRRHHAHWQRDFPAAGADELPDRGQCK